MDSAVKQKMNELVRRVRAGDTDAYDGLYRLTDGSLRAFLRRRYGRRGSDFVDEVAARTHERAVALLDRFSEDKGSSFQTWQCWQARAVAKEVWTEWHGPRLVQYDERAHEPRAATTRGPAEEFERERCYRVLREEVAALPEDSRRVLGLHDIEGRSHGEVARLLRMPHIRVRRLREEALARLRRTLLRRGLSAVEVDSTPAPTWSQATIASSADEWGTPTASAVPDRPVATDCAGAEPGGESPAG